MGWGATGWTPQTEYSSDIDDLARDFYAPAMAAAKTYDRITGFFSSGALLPYWPELRRFVDRGGHIRLLCSPRLSNPDSDGLERGYAARNDDELAEELSAELATLLARDDLRKPATAFAGLVAAGVVEVRFARVAGSASPADRRMFHDKVGMFSDADGQTIGVRGSANETFLGLSPQGNIESIDAWPSWADGRDKTRVDNATLRFNRLWNDPVPGVAVLKLPGGMHAVLREASGGRSWQEIVDELTAVQAHVAQPKRTAKGRTLRRQQIAGLAAWEEHGRHGILAHATGSGKTVTGIVAITEHDGPTLVVAPTELVARQWVDQTVAELAGTGRRVHLCGAGHSDWRGRLRTWVTDDHHPRVVVAVAPTASSSRFISEIGTRRTCCSSATRSTASARRPTAPCSASTRGTGSACPPHPSVPATPTGQRP